MDLSRTIMAKSDQLNADDLVGGPITITVEEIKAVEGDAQQPIAIFYGDPDGKAYKPCKSMRRVLVAVWGTDGKAFIGRKLTLFRDPAVMWGGVAVGGLRISHMSHMQEPLTIVISASKTKKHPIKIMPLIEEAQPSIAHLVDSVGQEAIESYLVSINWLKEGEQYTNITPEHAKTITDNEGAFLAAINKHKKGE